MVEIRLFGVAKTVFFATFHAFQLLVFQNVHEIADYDHFVVCKVLALPLDAVAFGSFVVPRRFFNNNLFNSATNARMASIQFVFLSGFKSLI